MTATSVRAWRVLILVWAMLMAPQMALVHALSHAVSHDAALASQPDPEHPVADKACHACLALAQFGAALAPGHAAQAPHASAAPRPLTSPDAALLPRLAIGFDARGPPLLPI